MGEGEGGGLEKYPKSWVRGKGADLGSSGCLCVFFSHPGVPILPGLSASQLINIIKSQYGAWTSWLIYLLTCLCLFIGVVLNNKNKISPALILLTYI